MSHHASPDTSKAVAADPLIVQFKSGMSRLAAGVSLIATRHEDKAYGLVVTSVSSLTAEPPTLLVCINHKTSAHDPISKSGIFTVNILPPDAVDIAKAFSDPNRREERFSTGNWTELTTGAPVLSDALVSFDCKVSSTISHGTHTIFLGEVVGVNMQEGKEEPLVYFNRDFRELLMGQKA